MLFHNFYSSINRLLPLIIMNSRHLTTNFTTNGTQRCTCNSSTTIKSDYNFEPGTGSIQNGSVFSRAPPLRQVSCQWATTVHHVGCKITKTASHPRCLWSCWTSAGSSGTDLIRGGPVLPTLWTLDSLPVPTRTPLGTMCSRAKPVRGHEEDVLLSLPMCVFNH